MRRLRGVNNFLLIMRGLSRVNNFLLIMRGLGRLTNLLLIISLNLAYYKLSINIYDIQHFVNIHMLFVYFILKSDSNIKFK